MRPQAPVPADTVDQPPFARLHGLACWHCGAVTKALTPAGEVTLDDDDGKVWAVVACEAHEGRPLP